MCACMCAYIGRVDVVTTLTFRQLQIIIALNRQYQYLTCRLHSHDWPATRITYISRQIKSDPPLCVQRSKINEKPYHFCWLCHQFFSTSLFPPLTHTIPSINPHHPLLIPHLLFPLLTFPFTTTTISNYLISNKSNHHRISPISSLAQPH